MIYFEGFPGSNIDGLLRPVNVGSFDLANKFQWSGQVIGDFDYAGVLVLVLG